MKIALIKPPFNFAREGLGLKTSSSVGHLPSLGLASLSAALKQSGHETLILDAPASGQGSAEIRNFIFTTSPDLIGFSLQIADAEAGLALINSLPPDFSRPLILGGPFTTHSFSEAARALKRPVYFILGEGEKPIINLANFFLTIQPPAGADPSSEADSLQMMKASASLPNQPPIPSIPGVLYRDHHGRIHGSPQTDSVPDLDSLPFPDYSIFFQSETGPRSPAPGYHPFPSYSRGGPAFPLITSRGCPYRKCTFCFEGSPFSSPYRRHSPERVVAEMEELSRRHGIREILFVDDIFTVNPEWVENFCRLLWGKKLDLSWVCYGKADLLNADMLKWMKTAGCYQIKFGFESGDQNLLDSIGKGFSLGQVREVTRWCQDTGIEVNPSFILGLPGETRETGEKTIQFALELNPDFAEFFACQPLPGTVIYEQAHRTGRLISSKFTGGVHEPKFIPSGYPDADSIRRMIKSAYRRFYLRPSYLAKSLRKIRSLGDMKRYLAGFQLFTGIITRNLKPEIRGHR